MSVHQVKSWPQFYSEIVAGSKTHDLRVNDRGYAVGDILDLREFNPAEQKYTGRSCRADVTYMTGSDFPCAASGQALHPDYCVLSIRVRPSDTE